MTITVAGITFDHHRYDQRGDVLYLSVGAPRAQAHGAETVEGHAVHYDEDWAVIGLTLLNVRATLDREGALTITLPEGQIAAAALSDLLAA
ncbi:MAG: hypothetical protein GXY03_10900 [Solirubrobacterales bacterium]|nr:hypothetical protein [Solirubrobacterales bacterium]